MPYTLLPDRAVLTVGGEDAADFLQGLISNDIRKATAGNTIFAALLTPQGKYLHDFFISAQDGQFLLETDKPRIADLQKRMSMYKLRSKVTLELLPELQVAASWDDTSASGELVYADPRLPALGQRIIGKALPAEENMAAYHHHRIALGVPQASLDLIPDRSLLLEYGYDELHGVDFAKGCYVGQEVTARSKHRATLRKFIHIVEGSPALPPPLTPIMQQGKEVGHMASSIGTLGLAHLRIEDARNSEPLLAGDVRLRAVLPSWCRTNFQTQD
jgi:folate-binding protein YgfZ